MSGAYQSGLKRTPAATRSVTIEFSRIDISEIYVPAKRRKTLEADKVEALAESILEEGQRTPVQVRLGNNRFVLIEGLHRLEAMKALGESKIDVLIVAARRH